jgi:hypothetical protein
MESAFEAAWWMPEVPQHADSLEDPGDVKVQQRHWIGVTPMEIELVKHGRVHPGLSVFDHGNAALELRESRCFGDEFGLFHTGEPGCDGGPPGKREKQTFSLNTAVMAVGEGNYGRLGVTQQRRFTSANRSLQLPEPDEQPGAMPEVAPSPDYGRSIDRPFYDRAMVLQAWGTYGTLWPVVHQQLGVRPDLGRGRLEVVPQLPSTAPIAAQAIRLGGGELALVRATRRGSRYTTTVDTGSAPVRSLAIGYALPRGSQPRQVQLDGAPQEYTIRDTSRGAELTVQTAPGRHTLEIAVG